MRELRGLLDRLRVELDEHDRLAATLGTPPSDWAEVPREDLEALMARARRIAEELEDAAGRLEALGRVPSWLGEDGRRGVWADDILSVLTPRDLLPGGGPGLEAGPAPERGECGV